MADGIVAEADVVAIGDHGLVTLADRERDEVVRFALQSCGDTDGNGSNHALEVERVERDFARTGIADSVGRLRDRREANDFGRTTRDCGRGLRHPALFYTGLRFCRPGFLIRSGWFIFEAWLRPRYKAGLRAGMEFRSAFSS
jgi:hypothetical protein